MCIGTWVYGLERQEDPGSLSEDLFPFMIAMHVHKPLQCSLPL